MQKAAPRKILLMEGVHPGAIEALEKAGYDVTAEKAAVQGDDLVQKAQGFDAIGIRSKNQTDKRCA